MTTRRLSFAQRVWLVGLATVGALGIYLLIGWCLGKLDDFLDPLNALAGVFVAFFTLVLLLIERERDHREELQEQQQRERTDQKVSAVSFLVSRQLASWLQEISTHDGVDGDLEKALNVIGEIGDESYRRILYPVLDWWNAKTVDQNEAERRLEELVAVIPEASSHVANAVRHSFVKFNDFAERWNQAVVMKERGDTPDWKEVVTGFKSLGSATAGLEAAIDPQLRAIRDDVTPLESPIHDLAEALRKEFEKT